MPQLTIQDRHALNSFPPYLRGFAGSSGRRGIIGRVQRLARVERITLDVLALEERIAFHCANTDPREEIGVFLNRGCYIRLRFLRPEANKFVPVEGGLEDLLTFGGLDTNSKPYHVWANRTDIVGADGQPLPHVLEVDETEAWSGVPTIIEPSGFRHYDDAAGLIHEVPRWGLAIPAQTAHQEVPRDWAPEAFALLDGSGPLAVHAEVVWASPLVTPSNCAWAGSQQPHSPPIFSGWVPAFQGTVKLELS